MKKVLSLPFLFTCVAIVEALYAALGLLIPPDLVFSLTGWVLTPDGQWLAKLLGAALVFQAAVAWVVRKNPHIGIAWALAGYQLLAATVDWILWVWLADAGIFSNTLAQTAVVLSIIVHYTFGILLVVGIRRHAQRTDDNISLPI